MTMYNDAERAIDSEEIANANATFPFSRRRNRQRSDLSMIVVEIRRGHARDDASCRLSIIIVYLKVKSKFLHMYHTGGIESI